MTSEEKQQRKDELEKNLTQLNFVELHLKKCPDDVEYIGMKNDLEELIELLKETISDDEDDEGSGIKTEEIGDKEDGKNEVTENDLYKQVKDPEKIWKVDERCLAVYTDKKYYPATVVSISNTGEAKVIYDGFTKPVPADINLLRPYSDLWTMNANKDPLLGTLLSNDAQKSNKQKKRYNQEKKKKKMKKLLEQKKEVEEEHAAIAANWNSFKTKLTDKTTYFPKFVDNRITKEVPSQSLRNAQKRKNNNYALTSAAFDKKKKT
ncbi:hypothetical protein SNEBB_006725 [Seison nebaliae]|nr:hypothetical protein SNEBB_006725 [Seison nebaliae]